MPGLLRNTRQRGQAAEDIALAYLEKQGLTLISRNYHAGGGEIDLVMQEQKTLVFIEVRYRKNDRYHAAIESVDPAKCRRIINTGHRFLQENRQYNDHDCRFDVITLSGQLRNPEVGWIRDAFQA